MMAWHHRNEIQLMAKKRIWSRNDSNINYLKRTNILPFTKSKKYKKKFFGRSF